MNREDAKKIIRTAIQNSEELFEEDFVAKAQKTIINADEKLNHKNGYSDCYVLSKDGKKKVSGKPVKLKGYEKIDFFVYKKNNGFYIAEKTTGLKFHTFSFQKDTIESAIKKAESSTRTFLTEKELLKTIQRVSETQSLSKVALKEKVINKEFSTIRKKHEQFAHSKNWSLDHDKLDFRVCCDLLKNNKRFKVEQALKENSPNLNDRHKDINVYVKKTVNNAYNKIRYKDKKIRGRNRKVVPGIAL
ncbi:MAG: hypothetical protein K8R67_03885 [Desulfobacteraceae bacterium]|nr:hypothetical protein [Desulfobacteraceae bacterium]